MARGLTTALKTALTAQRVYPVLFVQAQFTSGTIYLWSGTGSITWNAQTWIGVGKFGKVHQIPEASGAQADSVVLSLSGIPSDLLGQVLTDMRQGYPATIYLGSLDASGNVVVDPYKAFAGRIDIGTIEETGDTATASITIENRLIDMNRSRERRYTTQDQKIDYPGDLGFEFVPLIQEWNGVWGKPGSESPTGGGGDEFTQFQHIFR
jgi:hypothetical protein